MSGSTFSSSVARPALVTDYKELFKYLQAFADGHLNLLILTGPPGVQKTESVRAILNGRTCWLEGHITAMAFYQELWRNLDEAIVIDDVDNLSKDHAKVQLLRCLCQTTPVKTIAWVSNANVLRRERIPLTFETTSRVLIIANEWKTLGVHVAALEDRAHLIRFEPTPLAIHYQTVSWFWDQEVFDFIGQHLHLITHHSMRFYHLAWEEKRAELDWKGHLLSKWVSGKQLLVAALKADQAFNREEDRARAFIEKGAGSRATYFNISRRLPPKIEIPKIDLRNTPPDEPLPDSYHEAEGKPRLLGLPGADPGAEFPL
jgi:hypothetical protein